MISDLNKPYIKNRIMKHVYSFQSEAAYLERVVDFQNHVEKYGSEAVPSTLPLSITKVTLPHIIDNAPEVIAANYSGLKKYLILLFFKYKKIIKKIPIIGEYALSIKNQMLSDAKKPIDVSDILDLNGSDFINALYWRLLGRNVDQSGLDEFCLFLLKGMPKEGIIVIIASSDEFGTRAPVFDIDKYEKIYKNYKRQMSLKKIPLIGSMIEVNSLSRRVEMLTNKIHEHEKHIQHMKYLTNNMIDKQSKDIQ